MYTVSHTVVMTHLAPVSPLLLLLALLVLALGASGQHPPSNFINNFENDSEDWNTFRGNWNWADRASLSTTLPPGGDDGYMVMDVTQDSDELHTELFAAPSGGNFTMTFFARSQYEEANNLRVIIRNEANVNTMFLELSPYIHTDNTQWQTVTKEMPGINENIRVSVYIYQATKLFI